MLRPTHHGGSGDVLPITGAGAGRGELRWEMRADVLEGGLQGNS